jgi:hypothetical protein
MRQPEQPLRKLIGRHGWVLVFDKVRVFVEVVDVEHRDNSTGYIVTPHGGTGKWFVPIGKLELMQPDR